MTSAGVAPDMLDNMPWHALTGRQADIAEGAGRVRRLPRAMGIFWGVDRLDAGGWDALVSAAAGRPFVLFQCDVGAAPHGIDELVRTPCVQMVADGTVTPSLDVDVGALDIELLGDADAAEMVALTALTEPGPFFDETHRLGTYIGVRERGRLIAMAGERFRVDGAAEISGVCTHPDARRRGLAAALTVALMNEQRARGDMPMLHAAQTNTAAISVYRQLGFRVRAEPDGVAFRVSADVDAEVAR
ncbi:MAG: GNAT family N-acetyltransferase [Actinomycetota bacterium]